MNTSWYLQRLAAMSPGEVVGRIGDEWRKHQWRARQQAAPGPVPALARVPAFRSVPLGGLQVSNGARESLLNSADAICNGSWPVFDRTWDTLTMDWFLDPRTGTTAPGHEFAFGIDHRDESTVGNIKYVWEPSRHHMVTVLAAASRLSGDPRYGTKAIDLLESWWTSNPFLSGVHWTSGIELGIRLVSWVWVRRLLEGFPGVDEHFERNPAFLDQLFHHQEYLASFSSRGTSANNHLVVEMSGLYLAATAFPWFRPSDRWRSMAKEVLIREIDLQTSTSGINRELATSYHAFVAEFFLWSMVEGSLAGDPFPPTSWEILRRQFDAAAAIVDSEFEPPRQGDDDGAHSLLVDGPDTRRWESLLQTGKELFGAPGWWPEPRTGDVRSAIIAALGVRPPSLPATRPQTRPVTFSDAGLTVLRAEVGGREVWCRFDHGPHGYLRIAGHAHADALAVEVRIGAQPVLIDPGTYCYHGDPQWRAYFRSTAAHNTIEVNGVDQSVSGGPFIWTKHADTETITADSQHVAAVHHGYRRLERPVSHRRRVFLDPSGVLTIDDALIGNGEDHRIAMNYHLDHRVNCRLTGHLALLSWEGGSAQLSLPGKLDWSVSVGSLAPIRGWQSPGFDVLVPTTTLIGVGQADDQLQTVLTVGTDDEAGDQASSLPLERTFS